MKERLTVTQVASIEKESWIPKVSKRRIKKLAERIKPVVRMVRIRTTVKKNKDGSTTITEKEHQKGEWKSTWNESGELQYIKPVDLFDCAYTWGPKPKEKATGLKPLCDITTYHTYGYHGLFKPSIAEVLAQIPTEHVDRVVAFEIVESPKDANDLNREHKALNAGYHVAKTRLYVRE